MNYNILLLYFGNIIPFLKISDIILFKFNIKRGRRIKMVKLGIIVLDGLGIGAQPDVIKNRKQDLKANTLLHIIKTNPNITIPNLEKLGIINALGHEIYSHKYSSSAVWGKLALQYPGADTYLGHQEMMGSNLLNLKQITFNQVIDKVAHVLTEKGYSVKRFGPLEKQILIINDGGVIGDNLEADEGQIYNFTVALDKIKFEDAKKIGQIVRDVVDVSRVIICGGTDITLQHILNAYRTVNNSVGVLECDTGVYEHNYHVSHLGIKIKSDEQLPTLLLKNGIDVSLIGKTADIIQGKGARRFSGSITTNLINRFISESKDIKNGMVFLNIQETDLAGHSMNSVRYRKVLEVFDKKLPEIEKNFNSEDLLIITADHGNDPVVGSVRHTREYVPVLMYQKDSSYKYLGSKKIWVVLEQQGLIFLIYRGMEKEVVF